MYLNPDVWGPHYWFFLHTVTMTYPQFPNAITKKKYYELFHNLPLFLPVDDIAASFAALLDAYPLAAYLDNRESLVAWLHFIHNQINAKLEKPMMTLDAMHAAYYNEYRPKAEKYREYYKMREKVVFAACLLAACTAIYYLYDK